MNQRAPASDELRIGEKGLPRHRAGTLAATLGPRLLLATDLTDASRPAEDRALQLLADGRRWLTVLAVLPPGRTSDAALVRARVARLVDAARRASGAAEGSIVVTDHAGRAIVAAATERRPDAIILADAAGCRGAAESPLCGYVLTHSPCPVLVVREPRAR
jgi:nucleotide-binding universal stress UspA family protein